MSSFMDRLMGRKPSAAQSAKDRLKLVLVTDRTTISPEDLNNMQREILEIIKKYCRVREEDVELKFEQRERENFLVADIPLATARGTEAGAVRLETNIVTAKPPVVEEPAPVVEPSKIDPEATQPGDPIILDNLTKEDAETDEIQITEMRIASDAPTTPIKPIDDKKKDDVKGDK